MFDISFGRYKFLRFPYGINSASEIFEDRFRTIFNIEWTKVYINNIIVWGKTKEEHDNRLTKILQLAKDNNVRFNLCKCKLGKNKIEYLGHMISHKGMYPNTEKVPAIMKFQQPDNKNNVQQ